MEFIKQLLSGEMGFAAQSIAIIAAFNGVLMSIRGVLDVIKDKTSTVIDNKIADGLGMVCGLVAKLVDFLAGNLAHKKQ